MTDFPTLIRQVIEQWRAEDIPIRPAVTSEAITDFELRYRVKLPSDMRIFYSTVDGMGDHYDDKTFLRFWPLEQIKPIPEHIHGCAEGISDFDAYFVFFDHSIDVSLHAIRLERAVESEPSIARLSPPFLNSPPSLDLQFNSFTDFLTAYRNAPDTLF
jgi:hypothetical protein